MNANKTFKAKNTGKRAKPVQFIVLHDTAGNGGLGDVKYLANDPERRGVSVDFCIPKDGTIYQLNHDLRGRCTFHAGRRTRFRGHVNGGVNQSSIGIEIGQKANMQGLNPAYPPDQIMAVAQVCSYLCKEFDLTKLDITTHAKIITDGSRSDPRNFPWDQFWIYFNAGDAGIIGEMYHTVVAGDTLYALAIKYTTTVERIKALNSMNDMSNLISVGQSLRVKE